MELFSATPPKTPLAFHVGVTGHKELPVSAIPAITRTVAELLGFVRSETLKIHQGKVKGLYADGPAALRCISPLAEGADTIVARQALELGFEIQCPLPFERSEYEKDFRARQSLEEFRELLGRATAVLELCGSRKEQGEAYHAAGRVVLEHCDLLIAVWDGKAPKGRGGTGQIARKAMSLGIPLIVIDPANPDTARFILGKRAQDVFPGVESVIRELLTPPAPKPQAPSGGGLLKKALDVLTGGQASGVSPEAYFAETWRPASLLGKFPPWFERTLASQKVLPGSALDWARGALGRIAACPGALISRIAQGQPPAAPVEAFSPWCESMGLDDARTSSMERALNVHFAWADHLAIHYGGNFRALGLLRHLLMAAVICGLFIGVYIERIDVLGFAIQFLAFIAILLLVRINRKMDWHQRFLDYRYMAEHLRHMRYLVLLGRLPGLAHDNVDATCSSGSWPTWHLRNVARACGLAAARLGPGALEAYRGLLEREVIDDQIGFFNARRKRYDLISMRLNAFGTICYAVGLAFICLRVAAFMLVKKSSTFLGVPGGDVRALFNQVVLVIPALVSITFGVRSQGEYQRLAARYGLMADMLEQKRQALRELAPDDAARLAAFAGELAALLASEVSGWQVLVKSKAINPY